MKCKLCGIELTPENKCDAHIFPSSLLKLLTPGEYGKLKVVGTEMDKSKRTPIGSYDSKILCRVCDNKIGVYDGYARTFVETSVLTPHASGVGWVVADVDQHKLKMFCISYLWRASITSLPEFKGISLGPKHEEQIRQMLLADNSGTLHDYTVSIQKFSNNDGKFGGILFPAKTKVAGVTCYEAYLPNGYKIWIKVDSRKENIVSGMSVGVTEPLFIGDRGDFHSSREKAIMVKAVMRSK